LAGNLSFRQKRNFAGKKIEKRRRKHTVPKFAKKKLKKKNKNVDAGSPFLI
jgi:hypothetical protein